MTARSIIDPAEDEESRLRAELRRIARAHPRWGWRMAYRLLRRDTTKAWTGEPGQEATDFVGAIRA